MPASLLCRLSDSLLLLFLQFAIIMIMISLPLIAIVVYGVDKGTQNTLSELQQHIINQLLANDNHDKSS